MESGIGMLWMFIGIMGVILIGGYIVYKKGQ